MFSTKFCTKTCCLFLIKCLKKKVECCYISGSKIKILFLQVYYLRFQWRVNKKENDSNQIWHLTLRDNVSVDFLFCHSHFKAQHFIHAIYYSDISFHITFLFLFHKGEIRKVDRRSFADLLCVCHVSALNRFLNLTFVSGFAPKPVIKPNHLLWILVSLKSSGLLQ